MPREISKIKWNKEDMYQDIVRTYKNIHGYRTHSGAPKMAFERIIKKGILELKEPGVLVW